MTHFNSDKALMTVVAILVAGIVLIAGAALMPPESANAEHNPAPTRAYAN